MTSASKPKPVFKSHLIEETCRIFHVHPRDLLGDYRFKFLMPARFALTKARRMRGWTVLRIAKELGMDHSSMIYRIKEAEYLRSRDPAYAEKVHYLAKLGEEEPVDD
jgi:chromosomal replication initiation ATPase DnaA